MPEAPVQTVTLGVLAQAIGPLMAQWGLQAREVRLVKARENAVFRVVDMAGRAYALRCHRQGYHDHAALRSELAWMAALAQAGVQVPTLVPTRSGQPFASLVPGRAGPPWTVSLFEWIEGRALGTSETGLRDGPQDLQACYVRVGAAMARLHVQASGWTPPPGFRRHHWDAEALVGEQPLWGRFWEFGGLSRSQRALLLAAREAVRLGLRALSAGPEPALPRSLIHADLVPENILVTPDGGLRIIDFDDAGFGWQLFDLATALYFIQDGPHHDQAREALLRGYRDHHALPEASLRHLPLFMTARGFTYLGWVHTRAQGPEHLEIAPRLVQLACRQAQALLDG